MNTRDIRNVRLSPEGFWIAELHSPVGHVHVHRRYGSWMTGSRDGTGTMYDVLPHVAADLQAAVRDAEKEMAAERKREDQAAAALGRVRARVTGASPPASRGSNGSRVPSRLS